jgi:hypothetical protein
MSTSRGNSDKKIWQCLHEDDLTQASLKEMGCELQILTEEP